MYYFLKEKKENYLKWIIKIIEMRRKIRREKIVKMVKREKMIFF
jgi:hypothetical protein